METPPDLCCNRCCNFCTIFAYKANLSFNTASVFCFHVILISNIESRGFISNKLFSRRLTNVKLFPSPATQCMAMVFLVSLRDAGWSSAVVVTIAVVPSPSARCTAMLFTVSFEDEDWSLVFVVVVAVVLSPSTQFTAMLFTVFFKDKGWSPAVVVVRAVFLCPLFFAEEPVL